MHATLSLAPAVVGLVVTFSLPAQGTPPSSIVGVGSMRFDSAIADQTFVAVAPCAALRADGTVVEWGPIHQPVPALPGGTAYVEIDSSSSVVLARRSDGEVLAWGVDTTVPPLPPGTTYTRLGRGSAGFHHAALRSDGALVAWGSSCAGSLPATTLVPEDTPRIGRPLRVRLDRLPLDVAVLFTGFSDVDAGGVSLPVDLGLVGAPNCTLRTSLDLSQLLVGAGGRAIGTLDLPDDPTVVGLQLFQQAAVFDTVNPLGLLVSDAAALVVGS